MPFYIFETGTQVGADDTGYAAVRQAQEQVASADLTTRIVFRNAIDFPGRNLMSDAFHYTQTGYNEMGSIGAANVLSSQSYAFFQRTASTTSDIYFTAGNVGVGTTSPAALFFDLLDVERPKWQAPQALTPGKHTIVFDWKMDPQGTVVGRGGTGTLSVDGREVAKKSLPRTQPIIWAWDETFDIGRDTGTSVNSEDYSVPFPFTGTIGKITIDLGESTVSAEAIKKMMTELATKRDR